MYRLDVIRLIKEIRGPKGVAALNEELHKVSSEISRLSKNWKPQAEARLKKAHSQYLVLRSRLNKAQTDLEKEVMSTLKTVKKSAAVAEKKIKVAIKSKAQKSSALKAKAAKGSKKKSGAARTSRKKA